MIRLEGATKYFVTKGMRKTIIEDVWVDIPPGRNIGLLGRNGAGKSTLLRLIAGTMRLDRGRIVRKSKVSWPLGFAGSFHQSLTGEQNVRFVGRIYGVDTDDLVAYVEDFAELGPYFRMRTGMYSSGMKARLAFGVSMGIDFEYYLVDELTAVGDTNFRKKSQAVFASKREKSNLIMVSHSTGTIRDYCDCGFVLEDGLLTYYENIEDAIAAHDANMEKR